MIKIWFKWLLWPLMNDFGKGGGTSGSSDRQWYEKVADPAGIFKNKGDNVTTTTVEAPGITKQHRELLKAQQDLERINQELITKYAGRYDELSKQQLQAFERQAKMQQEMQQELIESLSPDEQEQLAQEMESELIAQQMGYLQGEMPEMTLEEAAGLEAFSQLAKEETLSNVLQQQEDEMLQAKNIAMTRGLGSSSFRESMEGQIAAQALGTLGGAEREIEAMKMQAGWDLPRAAQTFTTGLSELQQAINWQAEQNRAALAASLAASGVTGGIPGFPEISGTRFTYPTEASASAGIPVGVAPVRPFSPSGGPGGTTSDAGPKPWQPGYKG